MKRSLIWIRRHFGREDLGRSNPGDPEHPCDFCWGMVCFEGFVVFNFVEPSRGFTSNFDEKHNLSIWVLQLPPSDGFLCVFAFYVGGPQVRHRWVVSKI